MRFQHTAARRRLAKSAPPKRAAAKFQHTAARRRLVEQAEAICEETGVSTHSRPKAAGGLRLIHFLYPYGFNTQPPEGGWKRLQ